MPTPLVPALVETLCRHALLEPEQLAVLEPNLRQYPDPRSFLKDLLKRNWLTRFQAQMLWDDKGSELVLGTYILLEALGEGGMGQVYKARHRNLQRIVAVKRLRPEFLTNERAIKRFTREFRAVAQLSHPNIVMAYDADQVDSKYFLVMEFVEGTDLAHWVKQQGPLPVNAAVDYIRQTALGLQHAFERGLVHRDIKPSNLLLSLQGQIKILDLGMARFEGGTESLSSLTHQGTVLGSVDFIAPEQATDASSADIRADLYSLGCTFYYLLTGQVPFPGGEVLAKVLKHRLENPVPVELIRPDVPEKIIGIVRTLMMKRPEDRFATPADLAAALSADALPSMPNQKAIGTGPLHLPANDSLFAHLHSETPDQPVRRRQSMTFKWLAAVILLSLSVGIMVYFLRPLLFPALNADPAKTIPAKKTPS
jgi:serine/threonine protein kinase